MQQRRNGIQSRHRCYRGQALGLEQLEAIVLLAADLVARDVSASATNVCHDQRIDVEFEVQNQGDRSTISLSQPTGSSRTGIVLSTDTTIDRGDRELATEFLGPLLKGTSSPELRTVTIPSVPPGNYYLGTIVDYLGEIDEGGSGERNNSSAPPLRIAIRDCRPDLIVGSVTNVASHYLVGDRIQATVEIRNQGDAAAGRSDLQYYLGTDQDRTAYEIEQGTFASLEPGRGNDDSINWLGWKIPQTLPPGIYRVWVRADSTGDILEHAEDNNWGRSHSFAIGRIDDLRWEDAEGNPISGAVYRDTVLHLSFYAQGFDDHTQWTADVWDDDPIQDDRAPDGENVLLVRDAGNRWRGTWTAVWTEDELGGNAEYFFSVDGFDEQSLTIEVSPLAFPPYADDVAPGVTVITHGFQALGGIPGIGDKPPSWTMEMAEAILDRADGPQGSRSTGTILVHEPVTGNWVDPSRRGMDFHWTNSYSIDEELVLVFDWVWESNDLQPGWSEAAADSLYASLAQPFDGFGTSLNLLQRPLHFIGHSRGTVVNALAAHRMNHFFPEEQIEQFTTLDPHPAVPMKDPGYVERELSIPDNVVWADNYFRRDGFYEDTDFDGVRVPGAWNLELTESVLNEAGKLQEHSDVHFWYRATIDPLLELPGLDRPYQGWWQSGVAYDDALESDSGRNLIGFARSRIGGRPMLTEQMDRAQLGSVSEFRPLFNGDFEFGVAITNEIPGWERHGGGGDGKLGRGADGNAYLLLDHQAVQRTHNPLYFPPEASGIQFDLDVSVTGGSENDQLLVLLGDQAIGAISLESNDISLEPWLALGEEHRGFVERLTFQLVDPSDGQVTSNVHVDNVQLTYFDRLSGDANQDGEVGFDDFAVLASHFGKSNAFWTQGDFDYDGIVSLRDFLILSHNFGQRSLT